MTPMLSTQSHLKTNKCCNMNEQNLAWSCVPFLQKTIMVCMNKITLTCTKLCACSLLMVEGKTCGHNINLHVPIRAATIHRCTSEPRYFLSRYQYRYLNGISLYRRTTKHFSSKIKNYFTNIQKLLL